jgi:glutamyl-tRNA synthetase
MEQIILNAIRTACLQNAVKFKGSCNPKAIIGYVIKDFPEVKDDMQELNKNINKIAKEINELDFEQQKEELLAIDSTALDKKAKKKKKDLFKELPNADNGVVMRFAPSPSGPMHIGHAFSGIPTSIYVNKYGGKFILRVEDTNPDNIYVPAYKMLPEDADWIFGNVSEVWIQSDRMQTYYEYAEKLIKNGSAYVCDCDNEKFKGLISKKTACPCRDLNSDEHLKRWNKMFDLDGYKQGDAVLRFKADINHKNPAMRDFPLARINDSEHPRQGLKYRVWPLMNLSVSVDDIEAGMTHIIRAKDHQINAERQKLIYFSLGIKDFPVTLFLGRWNFEGLELSCSKTKNKINDGVFDGWDDIRTPFLRALRRRGYQAAAFKKFVENVGITSKDKKMTSEEFFKSLNSFNKEVVDPIAKRFFFIDSPKEIIVKNAPIQNIELDLHPDNIKGGRKFSCNEKFIISEEDFNNMKDNKIVRLMDCLNFKKQNKEFIFDSLDYEVFKEQAGKNIIHWLPNSKDLIDIEVLMPNNKIINGKAEKNISMLKSGDIIQFERFGFCRLDSVKNKKYKFWFTHR